MTGDARPRRDEQAPSRARRVILSCLVFVILAGLLSAAISNEVTTVTRDHLTARFESSTSRALAATSAKDAAMERRIDHLDHANTAASASLAKDAAKLTFLKDVLTYTESEVARQGAAIGTLQRCLAGVDQALNALSTNEVGQANASLSAATSACQAVVSSYG